MESLDLNETINKIKENNPNVYADSIKKMKEPAFKKLIFEECLSEKNISYNKLVNIALSDVITEKNYKEITNDINKRLSEEKQGILIQFPIEEIMLEWQKNPPLEKDGVNFYIDTNELAKKISKETEDLFNEDKKDAVKKIFSELKKLSGRNGVPDIKDCLPKEIKDKHLYRFGFNDEDLIKVATGEIDIDFLENYQGHVYIPYELIPDSLSSEAQNKLCQNIFYKQDLNLNDLKLYKEKTGNDEILGKESRHVGRDLINKMIDDPESKPQAVIYLKKRLSVPNNSASYIMKFFPSLTDDFMKDEEIGNKLFKEYFPPGILESNDESADKIKKAFLGQDIKDFLSRSFADNYNYVINSNIEIRNLVKEIIKENILLPQNEKPLDFLNYYDLNLLEELLIDDDIQQRIINEDLPEKVYENKAICNILFNNPSFVDTKVINNIRKHNSKFLFNTIKKLNTDVLKNLILNDKFINEISDNFKKTEDLTKINKIKKLRESFLVSSNPEKLPEEIQKTIEIYKNKYGEKGKNLTALAIAAYGLEKPKKFISQMEKFEKILDLYKPENIPEGAHVSMGFEYEVTSSIAEEYNNGSALGYKNDILLASNSSNIGIGRDALHEIASKPTYNPYMIMAEMKLLQDAEFLDLNHEKYPKSARGHHLSLVGESGLRVNEDMYFLNNVMTMAQLTGVTTGKNISYTKDIHTKSFEYFEDTKEQGSRVELKGMSPDGVEIFEKTIITSHNAGIATQVCNKYINNVLDFNNISIPNSSDDFEKEFLNSGYITKPFETKKERDIAYNWIKFKKDTVDSIKEHNESFVSSEFSGSFVNSKGEYIDTSDDISVKRNKKLISNNEDEVNSILESDNFKNKIKLNPADLFHTQNTKFVNSLIEINNIFLKGKIEDNKMSSVNAFSVLSNMKKEGYQTYETGDFRESIFDTGELRNGYYAIQGASEEMITQKSQILLNRFNSEMARALNQTESKNKAEEVFA